MKKFTDILSLIYGWGIFVCLFLGGLTFLGYLIAFVVGGQVAVAICAFIKSLFKVLIYGGNVLIVLELINMYLKREKTLTMKEEH